MTSAAELQEVVSFPDKQLTGVGVSIKSGRIFVNFPYWSDDHSISVTEIVNGQPKAFLNDEWNTPGPAGSHFVCVQSVIVDDQDNLWVLDPAAPRMQEIVKGGPKLVKIDLATNQVVQTIPFGEDVAPKKSYLNDVRTDTAFITESANGAIIVVDLKSGKARRLLDHAQQDYDRVTKLSHEKVVAKQDLDNATAALRSGKAAMDAATSDLATAEAALHNAELQLSYTTIVAPADGVVGKKTVETGARIQPGQALMAVVERNVWVLGNFKETQIGRMRVGQHVDVKIDAIPDHKFSAHIDSLQPGTGAVFSLLPPDNATGNFTKIVQRVPVKIVFDDMGEYRSRVVPGLSCEPKIDLRTGKRE